ncbi:uncharacterized protein LOC118598500 [Oryzias melastigma]|uniref:uncharacterized protein LOC118598500 n=1 Tax=Oryzias melastigma TaxID=30732 RepID=UPI00168D388B|nr:uncharacterized protein LOC118598500 [Oryzias melastigma]
MLQNNPKDRPTAAEVLARLFAFTSLTKKSKAKVEKIQKMLKALRALADGLEKTHLGTTIGSLTGGVIGIVGGIATLGVTLAPVTLGGSFLAASLGIGLVGGITAGTSNITKLVKHKFQRKVIESLLTELGLVIAAVVTWLMERNSGLEISQSQPILENEDSFEDKAMKSLTTMGKTTHRILVRSLFLNGLFKTAKTAGQASRVAQVAKAATCALTGIFIAVDVFCVVMDAKEIHCARQASSNKNDESEIITFIKAIHKHSDDLQILVDLLNSMI